MPSCVLFAEVHTDEVTPQLPAQVVSFTGALPKRDADRAEADASLAETVAPWPTIVSTDQDGSPYRRYFRNGATLFPRRLVLVDPVPQSGILPSNPAFPLVRGRTGPHDKAPWKTVPPPEGTIEQAFLRPVLLGESIAPFCILTRQLAVIPWDEERGQLMDATQAGQYGYPRLSQWLEKGERLWGQHKRSSQSFIDQLDHYRKCSNQFPISPIRVVYTKAGTHLAACIIRDETTVVDHQLYWASFENIDEARYLCAILNSGTLRASVSRYQSQGQWGARHFDKYVFNLPIPRFDTDNSLHRALAQAAQTAEGIAQSVSCEEGEYFIRIRQRIRAALAEHGIARSLEHAAARLLGGT